MVLGTDDQHLEARPPFMPPGKRAPVPDGQFNELALSLLSIGLFYKSMSQLVCRIAACPLFPFSPCTLSHYLLGAADATSVHILEHSVRKLLIYQPTLTE